MESITTRSGFFSSMTETALSSSVSHRRKKSGPKSPILMALILICFSDSSPETYRTVFPVSETARAACRRIVDLPMPGSPPTKTRDPVTTPPPSTLSNSASPLDILCSSVSSISESLTPREGAPAKEPPAPEEALPVRLFEDDALFGASVMVFHS